MKPSGKSHRQHAGELAVQRRRGVPPQIGAAIAGAIHDDMPSALVDFYRSLPFLPLGTLDADGRPWVTLLSNPQIVAPSSERLAIRVRARPEDPLVRAVRAGGSRPFAGVAIDFAKRRRVKLAGSIEAATFDESSDVLTLELSANEHMGNCPKYITARQLRPTRRQATSHALGATLSSDARALLERASTLFMATRHVDADPRESDMGLNHRGGPRGFVRYFEDDHGGHLVLPDYSGNRFYQSLGNVETDPVIGIAIPDFASGALLQVTGRARNVFDDEAAAVLPGATLITVVTIEEAMLTEGAVDLALVGAEQLSPYNPPVRSLVSEAPRDRIATSRTATLVDITPHTKLISTFTFELDEPLAVVPGGYVILDFSKRIARWYQHMNDQHPRSLNDDLVRTFTVSRSSEDGRQLSITVKKTGVVSSYLHSLSRERIELSVLGAGGTFTCFKDERPLPRMVWVAGGVGLTPFLAMARALRASRHPMPEIDVLYACRGDEVALLGEEDFGGLRVQIFDSTASRDRAAGGPQLHARRMTAADLAPLLAQATVFVCGPPALMRDVASWVDDKLEPGKLRMEDFEF